MAYDRITNAEIDRDSPVTQPLLTKYRDNILVALEGIWRPYDMVYPDDGADGVFYDHSVDGTVASVETPDFVDGYDYRFLIDKVETNVNSRSFQVQFFLETSNVYSSASAIQSASPTNWLSGDFRVLSPRRPKTGALAKGEVWSQNGASPPSEIRAEYANATEQKITRLRFSMNIDQIGGGRLLLFRRINQETW